MPTEQKPIYKRIVLKLTGEAFSLAGHILNMHAAEKIADEIEAAYKLGVEIAIMVGGGNIMRGRDIKNIKRETADKMGMTATFINVLFLQDTLEKRNIEVRTQTAVEIRSFAELYISRRAERHLQKKRIVIFGYGSGLPRCSTDYAGMLKAYDIGAEALLKGTKVVDGLYDKDPRLNKNAKLIPEISYKDLAKLNFIDIIDHAAFGLVMDSPEKIPIHIFNILKKNNLKRVLLGEKIGSKIVP